MDIGDFNPAAQAAAALTESLGPAAPQAQPAVAGAAESIGRLGDQLAPAAQFLPQAAGIAPAAAGDLLPAAPGPEAIASHPPLPSLPKAEPLPPDGLRPAAAGLASLPGQLPEGATQAGGGALGQALGRISGLGETLSEMGRMQEHLQLRGGQAHVGAPRATAPGGETAGPGEISRRFDQAMVNINQNYRQLDDVMVNIN